MTSCASSSPITPRRRRGQIARSGAIETEHHEIAVYEVLVTNAEARGAPEVAALLRENLEQEKHTLEEASRSPGASRKRATP